MSNDFADSLEAQLLVDYIADGMTFIDACKHLGYRRQSIYERMERSPRFREMVEKARTEGYDAIANQCLAIADETAFDTVETDKGLKANKEWMARSRLRVDTRLKLLAKWHPHKYGEKIETKHTTDGDGPGFQVVIQRFSETDKDK
jgi:hypothetical protein